MPTAQDWTRRLGVTNEALFVADDDGRIRYWNAGARRLTGYTAGEVLGKRCYAVLCGIRSGRSWCRADCAVRQSVRAGVLPGHATLDVLSKDGRRFPVTSTFIVHKVRRKPQIVHVLHDDSRQEAMRQTLRRIQNLLRGLGSRHASIPVGIGTAPAPPEATPARPEANGLSILTRRELQVLQLLTEGLTTETVATRLGVSRFTARNHIQNTLRKLGLRTRTQAIAVAFAEGLC